MICVIFKNFNFFFTIRYYIFKFLCTDHCPFKHRKGPVNDIFTSPFFCSPSDTCPVPTATGRTGKLVAWKGREGVGDGTVPGKHTRESEEGRKGKGISAGEAIARRCHVSLPAAAESQREVEKLAFSCCRESCRALYSVIAAQGLLFYNFPGHPAAPPAVWAPLCSQTPYRRTGGPPYQRP